MNILILFFKRKSIFTNLNAFFDKIELKNIGKTTYINIYYYPLSNVTKKHTLISPKLVKRYKSLFLKNNAKFHART